MQLLFESFPLANENCEEAFKSAEIEWESEKLDNDSIFHRAKNWVPGGSLKAYSLGIDKLTAYIERASEDNSFSLTAPASIDKDVLNALSELTKTRELISNKWLIIRESFTTINADFIVPNELDNSCEQMQDAIKALNKTSQSINEQIQSFQNAIKANVESFQSQYSSLSKIKHPMVNNQALDELSNLVIIINEMSNLINFHYKNMVETRMAWNNALCKN
ncbi:MAG: hypothetical protein IPO78_11410 [Saprospiraceae bacterium]|nr:hypothetical protein [Saprospiraceae bacterium]MBK9722203.1 hypothetical protein [Saprospiraceae bacterium]MBK9729224.1 hypothetical protein [Saprospiraceae bacterium]